MSRSMVFSLGLLAVMGSVGCGDAPHTGDSPASTGDKAAENSRPVELEPGSAVSAQILVGADANDYRVQIKWNTQVTGGMPVQIHRNSEGQLSMSTLVESNQSQFVDTPPRKGVTYSYSLSTLAGGTTKPLGDIQKYVPEDFVVTTPSLGNATSDLCDSRTLQEPCTVVKYRRIFFEEDGLLQIGFHDLSLIADELIMLGNAGGKIENLTEDQVAETGKDGVAGGQISVRVRRASGTLAVVSRGQRGGPGAAGLPGGKGQTGAAGMNARWKGGDFERGLMNSCIFAAADGSSGGAGGAGGWGTNGGNGGPAARIDVKVAEESPNFVIKPTSIGGVGGKAGLGGSGGEPGDGGAPGSHDPGADWPRNALFMWVGAENGVFCAQGQSPFFKVDGRDAAMNPLAFSFFPATKTGPRGAPGTPGVSGAPGLFGRDGDLRVEIAGKAQGF